jgi:integrase
MLDTGMRPAEVYRMQWNHVKWDRELIFVPRSKSRKSKRYVSVSERVKRALQMRPQESSFVFASARSRSGHIETVQKQFDRAKQLAGLPDPVVLYCARHRFSTDAMDGTGNMMAVMDVMGHSKVDVMRIYQHPGLKQIGMAINKRNEVLQ